MNEWVARSAPAALAVACLAAVGPGCLPPPVRVDTARTGEQVVRVARPRDAADVAEAVWGDRALGPVVAQLAGLAPGEPVPAGAILVLPPRDEVEARRDAELLADERHQEGLAAADAGRWQEAAARFREALAASPHRLDTRYNLGLALMRAGELADATAVLGEVAAARPDDADSRYAFGSVLRQRRAWDRALGEFRAASRLAPGDPRPAFAAARTLEDLGRDRDAVRAWRDFLAAFPGDALARDATRRLEETEARLRAETAP